MAHLEESVRQSLEENFILTDRCIPGGLGTVIKAFDRENNNPVAIKVLKRGAYSDSKERQEARLIHEAGLAGRLVHPGIVRVLGVETRPVSYLITEWIDGHSWRDKPPAHGLPSIIDLLIEAGEAVTFAHRFGVLHLDLSPRNIMIDHLGHVRVIDFGLASLLEEDSEHVGGTPGFIAPERLKGMRGDMRSDVYSFGALAFWLITGVHVSKRPEDNRIILGRRPEVAEELIDIISKCLAEEPEQRPASLGEALLMLRNAYPRLIKVSEAGDEVTKVPASRLWRLVRFLAIRAAVVTAMALGMELFCEIVGGVGVDAAKLHERLYLWWRDVKHMSDADQVGLFLVGLVAVTLIIRVLRECKFYYEVMAAANLLKSGDYDRAMAECRTAVVWRKSRSLIRTYAQACVAQKHCDQLARSVYEQAYEQGTATAEVKRMLAIIYDNMPPTEPPAPRHIATQVCMAKEGFKLQKNDLSQIDRNSAADNAAGCDNGDAASEARVRWATKIITQEQDRYGLQDGQVIYPAEKVCPEERAHDEKEASSGSSGSAERDRPAQQVLELLEKHFISAENAIRDDVFCDPTLRLWFFGFAFGTLVARCRIEGTETALRMIFDTILCVVIGCCFGIAAIIVLGLLVCLVQLLSSRLHDFLWRNFGKRNTRQILGLIRRLHISPSEYRWALNIKLLPDERWRYVIHNAVREDGYEGGLRRRRRPYRALGPFDWCVLAVVSILFLLDIIMVNHIENTRGSYWIAELFVNDILLYWSLAGAWTVGRVIWMSREASLLTFIRQGLNWKYDYPGLRLPGSFFVRSGELCQKGFKAFLVAIIRSIAKCLDARR